ncbi:activating molecule in BECN1-regulated autophagy protein 1-like [Brevipalpus obovatus]|uniref:activating molecule in BECN1-regulated autophagy protein 1-like n=1 Tax=Brevipalpus obovatus TaxID=246614 RepID=UPI003D9F340A
MMKRKEGIRFPGLQHRLESRGLHQDNKSRNILKRFAEDKIVGFNYEPKRVALPSTVKSTFLVVFSPDGSKMGSTHGDHKIYVTDVKDGKIIRTLEGHPRTPWCLAFHPSLTNILASGCLAGQVRVWDLKSGDCELWVNSHDQLIASLAFHPIDHLILIATYNELHFWDWRQRQKPFLTLTTPSEKEKVRFVKFDVSGRKIITGISNIPPLRSHSHTNHSHYLTHHYPDHTSRHSHQSVHPTNTIASSLLTPRSPDSMNTSTFDSNAVNLPHSSRASSESPASLAMRRSNILSRVMSMYRQLDGLEETRGSYMDGSSSTSPSAEPEELNRMFESSSSAEHFLDRFRNPHHPDSPLLVSNANSMNLASNARSGMTIEDVASASGRSTSGSSTSDRESALSTTSRPLSPAVSSRIDDARDFAQFLTERFENSSGDGSGSSTPTQGDDSNLMSTFHELHSFCTRLASLIQLQGENGGRAGLGSTNSTSQLNPNLSGNNLTATSVNPSTNNQVISRREDESSNAFTANNDGDNATDLQSSSISLTGLVDRLHSALQNMSTAALTSVMAHEQIQQARQRVYEILEHLGNVSGYRARLSNLRDQLFEMAEQTPESDQQRLDFIHCLWLVEMCIQLTKRLQRILAADVRLNQLALNSSLFVPSSSNDNDSRESISPIRYPARERNPSHTSKRPRLSLTQSATTSSVGSPSGSRAPGSPRNDSDDSDSRQEPIPSTSSGITRPRYQSNPWLFRSRSMRGGGGSSPSSPRSSPRSTPSPVSYSSSGQTLRSPMFNIPTVRISGPEGTGSWGVADDLLDPRLARNRPRSPPLPEIHQVLHSTPFSERYSVLMPPTPPPNMSSLHNPSPHIWLSLSGASAGHPELGVFSGPAIGNHCDSRIQCWNFSQFELPDLKDAQANIVVQKCRIQNDASIDISQNGDLLACLVPVESSTSVNLCIYSLNPQTFAQCFYVWTFGSNALSVSLSEMSRYILVGLASPHASHFFHHPNEPVITGQVFKLNEKSKSSPPTLQHIKNIEVLRGDEYFSLTSIKWLPNPGQGLIYATNRGHLVMCRPNARNLVDYHPSYSNPNHSRSTTGTQTCSLRTGTLSIGTQTTDVSIN